MSTARSPQPLRRIFVAGGGGFVGSHLVERLLAGGAEVVVADNLCTGSVANLAAVLSHPRLCLLAHDVCHPIDPFGPLDAVLHLASPASPIDYARLPIETLEANTKGTRNLLELAFATGARLLFASSSEVYGEPQVHPQVEHYRGNVSTTGPRAVYDEGKRAGEAFCAAYASARDVDVRIARVFNTYGPRMRRADGRAVPTFVAQALAGTPITVFGDGSQTRSLCFIDDLVDGLLRLLTSDVRVPVNLGNPIEMTVLELANVVRELCGSRSEIVHRPLPVDDPKRRRPDITRAEELLGWRPRVPLADGLQRTIAWFAPLAMSLPATTAVSMVATQAPGPHPSVEHSTVVS